MHLRIIGIERIPLLQVYFSHVISKQGSMFEDICCRQDAQFCSICSTSGLIYYGLQTVMWRAETMRDFFLLILLFTMKFLRIFSECIYGEFSARDYWVLA